MSPEERSFDRLQRLLGDAISELRRTRGLSVAELADAAGISEPAMTAIETGFDPPTIVCFVRICGALECEASEMLAAAEQRFRTSNFYGEHDSY
ncbi:MAG: helix-turn-helix transcriptional regulator [Candidatus Obscuribacterales bacterium]|jgi:transcriptional regulator with XRE-family HTH domain